MTPTAYEPVTSTVDHGTTRDGVVQLRRRWQPSDPARATVLLLHGIAEHSGRYEHVGRRLADAGVDVVAIDHRGFGGSGGRRGHCDNWSQFCDDVEDHMAEICRVGLPPVLFGHSMGGLIATGYVVDERIQPDLLVLSGPALGADIPRHLRVAAPILGRVTPNFVIREDGDPAQLSTDPAVGEVFHADPARVPYPTARLGWELMKAIDKAREGITNVTMPTLVLHGGDDTLVPTEVSEIYETLDNVDRRVYPGLRHEILNEPGGLEIVDGIVAWIDDHL